jgi:hypothetical protein
MIGCYLVHTQNENQDNEHQKNKMAMDCYLYLGLKPPIKHEMDYKNCVTWKNKKQNMIKKNKIK